MKSGRWEKAIDSALCNVTFQEEEHINDLSLRAVVIDQLGKMLVSYPILPLVAVIEPRIKITWGEGFFQYNLKCIMKSGDSRQEPGSRS